MADHSQKLALVTGGAGFIGSHLCERLVRHGYKIVSLDNYFTGSVENHLPQVEYRRGHTKDIESLVPETPDIIYHLGEYARVEQSVCEPELVHDLNVVGTSAVVEFWKKKGCKLVYAGSSTKFGDGGVARGATPYAASKTANSEVVIRVGDTLGLPYAVTYFYNVYGPRERAQPYGTVIEIFKRAFLSGMPLVVTAPGTQRRNFTHVLDIVDGLVLVGERGQGDGYGIGNKRSFSIMEVAELFHAPIVMGPERQGNRNSSDLDTTKICSLGWSASRELGEYIQAFLDEGEAMP